ncbi:hypothetical protein [Stenotrophomonas maltophilia]
MDYWNSQAKQLQMKLLEHTPELLLHFLRTASDESIKRLAGEALPESDNTRSSIISHLAASLMSQDQSDVFRVTPEMATAISANCHHAV